MFYYVCFSEWNYVVWFECYDVYVYVVMYVVYVDEVCCYLCVVGVWYWDWFDVLFVGYECFW